MSIESDFYAELAGDGELRALVGEEIYPSHAAEGVQARKFVVYTPIAINANYDLDGPTGVSRVRMQADCYGETPDDAAALARAVIAAVPVSGWPIHRTGHDDQDMGLETGTRLFRRLVEFSLFHRSS